jgi:hypothetical protein
MHRPAMPTWMRKNGRMVCVYRRLVYGSCAVPATQRPGLEDRKKEDGAGECMIGEIDSDGGSEMSKCQNEDGWKPRAGEVRIK